MSMNLLGALMCAVVLMKGRGLHGSRLGLFACCVDVLSCRAFSVCVDHYPVDSCFHFDFWSSCLLVSGSVYPAMRFVDHLNANAYTVSYCL